MRNFNKLRNILIASVVFATISGVSTAGAETLDAALVWAYRGNPTLNAERAKLRATDELVPQALSGWRPTVNAQGSVGHEWAKINGGAGVEFSPESLAISLNQPVFRGFQTVEGTAVAEANVKAERQQLLAVEQTTLFNAVQAYMNVIRDRNILSLRNKNVGVLSGQLKASQARFNAGELTRTDVAQSRASLDGAQAQGAVAIANMKASEANYLTVMGKVPGKLVVPHLAQRPGSLDNALNIAQATNPNILAAAQVEDAAEHNIGLIQGSLLPQLNLQATGSMSREASGGGSSASTAIVQGVLSVPIYEGGKVYSQVRQAKQVASQNRVQIIAAVRAVREGVTVAWNNVTSVGQSVAANRAQVSASKLALDGVQQEYKVGSRSTIDVLNAEQALLTAQISEVSAEHDQTVASYQLLAAMGELTAQHLHLGQIYNAQENYNDVRNKWIGLNAETGQ